MVDVIKNTNNNSLSTLVIFHAVPAAKEQLEQESINVDVPNVQNNIPGINRDHGFHQDVLGSPLNAEDQLAQESQILLQSLLGNSVLSHQDQLYIPASSITKSVDSVSMDFSREKAAPSTSYLLKILAAL